MDLNITKFLLLICHQIVPHPRIISTQTKLCIKTVKLPPLPAEPTS